MYNGTQPAGYAAEPCETVNYVSCHDGEVLVDQLIMKPQEQVRPSRKCLASQQCRFLFQALSAALWLDDELQLARFGTSLSWWLFPTKRLITWRSTCLAFPVHTGLIHITPASDKRRARADCTTRAPDCCTERATNRFVCQLLMLDPLQTIPMDSANPKSR